MHASLNRQCNNLTFNTQQIYHLTNFTFNTQQIHHDDDNVN